MLFFALGPSTNKKLGLTITAAFLSFGLAFGWFEYVIEPASVLALRLGAPPNRPLPFPPFTVPLIEPLLPSPPSLTFLEENLNGFCLQNLPKGFLSLSCLGSTRNLYSDSHSPRSFRPELEEFGSFF